MVDLSQINLEEMIRKCREKGVVGLMNIIIENRKKMLELQETLVMLTEREEKKKLDQRRRQENREQKRREYEKK